jgi:hypothetical protein|uniref:Uncharacterized protein n=1 Tax=Siphoviridae sp. cteLh2 TaxID=2825590 RepID=A0A8S5U5W1_9CAUD|nr:hypothetical protein [uncultured Lachnoclostridium sp.]DAF89843.1 MAG TPA: hypothetical protein [Siphoviridae sp. cteLh2]
MDRYYKIIAHTSINSYYCRRCNKTGNVLYKDKLNPKISYCDNCVTDVIKENSKVIDQNQNNIN